MAETCPHDGKAHHYFIVQYTGTCQKCGAIKEFPRQPMKGCFGTIWLGRREPGHLGGSISMVERPRPRRHECVFVEAATEAEVQRLPLKGEFRLGELVVVPNRGVFRVRGLHAHIEPDYEGDTDVWRTVYRVERLAVHRRQEAEGAVTLGIPMERDL